MMLYAEERKEITTFLSVLEHIHVVAVIETFPVQVGGYS